jgi:hypothetical protein
LHKQKKKATLLVLSLFSCASSYCRPGRPAHTGTMQDPADAQLLAAALACMDKDWTRARAGLLAAELAHNARLVEQVIDRVLHSPTSRLIKIGVDRHSVGGRVRSYYCRLFKALNGARWFECSTNSYRYRWSVDELADVAAALSSLCHVGIVAFVPREGITYSVMQGISLTGSPRVWMQRVTRALIMSDKGKPWPGSGLLLSAHLAGALLDMSVARRSHPSLVAPTGGAGRATPIWLALWRDLPRFSRAATAYHPTHPGSSVLSGAIVRTGPRTPCTRSSCFADRVFASADMAIALKLKEPPDQEDDPAHLAPALSGDMRQRTPMPEPKDITSNYGETLLDEALGCHEWDGSIDADKHTSPARTTRLH